MGAGVLECREEQRVDRDVGVRVQVFDDPLGARVQLGGDNDQLMALVELDIGAIERHAKAVLESGLQRIVGPPVALGERAIDLADL